MASNPLELFLANENADPDEARFMWSGGPVDVAERTWFSSLFSGSTAFDTDEGLVVVDAGLLLAGPVLAQRARQVTQAPVHTAVYTHGHVDHAYGLRDFLLPDQAPPRVIAHANSIPRFARYERTQRHNAAINARQFGGAAQAAEQSTAYDAFQAPPIMPDTLVDTALTIEVGGVAFELHHCKGETDDHLWVWCPERKVLCTGDLFIYAVPNAGNPQKVQRYPWEWAAGLRAMAALEPESLCPGHGGPVVRNPEKVQHMLLSTAEYLESVVEQTLAALEDGSPPHTDIVHRVTPPASDLPWLQPQYDEPEFIVRNIIRYYGGWWTGRPCELKPAARADVAREIAELAGGATVLLERAQALADAGDWRLASHLADYALEAAPGEEAIQAGVAAFYRARAKTETSLMARNIFNSAAAYARDGRPFA